MQKKTGLLSAIGVLCLFAFTFIVAADWQPKEDSYAIKFDTKGASGIIKGLKGSIHFDPANLSSALFDVTVDVNTLNTGNGLKNHHARGDGFLDAKKYPVIHFLSTTVEKTAGGYQVAGKLTIKDVTKDVNIPFTFDNTGGDGTFNGHFAITRDDYHLNHGGVGEVINLELVIPVKKIS